MKIFKLTILAVGFLLLFLALNLERPTISLGEFIGLAWLADAPLVYQAGFLALTVMGLMGLWDLLSREY